MQHEGLVCTREEIEARNKKFEEMPTSDRLREVCTDVLKQLIMTPDLGVRTGAYFVADTTLNPEVEDLQDAIPAIPECRVCMLGALLFSKSALFNHAPLRDLNFSLGGDIEQKQCERIDVVRDKLIENLRAIGDPLTLNAMEAAFERSLASVPVIDYRALRLMAMTYRIDDAKSRAMVIARDIIRHFGTLSYSSDYSEEFHCPTFDKNDSDIFFGRWFFSQSVYDRNPDDPYQLLMFPRNVSDSDDIDYYTYGMSKHHMSKIHPNFQNYEMIRGFGDNSYRYVEVRDRRYSSRSCQFFADGRGIGFDEVLDKKIYRSQSNGEIPYQKSID